MKGKSPKSFGLDTNMTVACIFIAIIVIAFIFVIFNKKGSGKQQENFANNTTYQFKTARAGHGMGSCTLINSGLPKDVSQKDNISKKECPNKNGKKGHWVCNEVIYPDGRKRAGCGCLYGIDNNDPKNLFKGES